MQADDRIALTICGNVFVNVMRQTPTVAAINDMRRVSREMWERHRGRFASLSVMEPMAVANVSDEVRKASDAYTREFAIMAAAIVIEGKGFKGAALRTIIAGMYLFSRSLYPYKICGEVQEGAAWLAPRLPDGSPRLEELLEAVKTTRAAVLGQPA